VLEVEEMVADSLDVVIGVDTHRDAHTLALVAAASGALLLEAVVAASADGYRDALEFARAHAPGGRAWAIEGTGCYGAGLARFLLARGERVLEVDRPRRERRAERGKSDTLDALRAARSPLGGERLACPRRAGAREALRALVSSRESAVGARRAALNQLRALIVTCPEPLRAELRRLTRARLLRRLRGTRPRRHADRQLRGALLAMRLLAVRIEALTHEQRELEAEIVSLVRELAPQLLAEPGVGPITAASILLAWSHKGRLRSEAAFARLAGAPPIPASSGKVVRHRLDRGGDRKLNRALHTIILTRRRTDPDTIAYIQRRTREGKSDREAVRCLKRYLARSLFRQLEAMPQPA
jgi:transposase